MSNHANTTLFWVLSFLTPSHQEVAPQPEPDASPLKPSPNTLTSDLNYCFLSYYVQLRSKDAGVVLTRTCLVQCMRSLPSSRLRTPHPTCQSWFCSAPTPPIDVARTRNTRMHPHWPGVRAHRRVCSVCA